MWQRSGNLFGVRWQAQRDTAFEEQTPLAAHTKRCRAALASALQKSKANEFFQRLNALVDLRPRDLCCAGQAKAFAAEGGDHAAIDHRATEIFLDRASLAGEVADHSADERIARAGGINDVVQRKSRADEETGGSGEKSAVVPFFDDDVFGAQLVDIARRMEHVRAVSELMRLGFVQHESIDAFDEREQVFESDV